MTTHKVRNEYEMNTHKKMPPIVTLTTIGVRKPQKLKQTDQLVAAVEKRLPVPNHVLDTKIFAKLQRNQIFEVTPVEVHFAGFQVDEKSVFTQVLRIINISGQIQRMTVLPPKTKFFDVIYVKPERLVPGFALEIKVNFKPEEYKYYNDAIRIFSEGDENLYIPIHAYPIITSFDFPSKYKFPNLPIGKRLTRTFTIRSTAPIQFEYLIEILQTSPAFSIDPLQGIIPFATDTNINVTFSPKEFCTAVMTFQLVVSQFNSKPIVCSFYGSSLPGLDRDQIYSKLIAKYDQNNNIGYSFDDQNESSENYYDEDSDKQNYKLMKVAKKETRPGSTKDVAPKRRQFVEYEGYQFPVNLDAPWAVGKVLTQTKGKLSLKDLKAISKNSPLKISAQAKEQIFLQKVTELEDEERRNQLKWQVNLGENSIDDRVRKEILQSRANAVYEYQLAQGIPFLDQEIKRETTLSVDCRTIRNLNVLARSDVTFDVYKNKIWHLRYESLDKFIQGARKILIKNRLVKVLNLLKKFINSWNDAILETVSSGSFDDKLSLESYIEIYSKKLKGQTLNQNELLKAISANSLGTYYFPQVIEFREMQNQSSSHCEKLASISKLDSLGHVAVKPIEFKIKMPTPLVQLTTPVLYKLNCYKEINENRYISRFENRISKLRSGAEDELMTIDSTTTTTTTLVTEISVKEEEQTKPAELAKNKKIVDLTPSPHLSLPQEYSAMHIFNPAPGLISYQKLLPYSGIDLNHHLNPLPRFERDQTFSTQKRFMDHDDVVRGVMTWKKFPSQGLTSLSTNAATLTDVWVPRWSNDVFGKDILPDETPTLLTGLPLDDKEDLLDDEADEQSGNLKIFLTPEMVNAQFNLPGIFETREKNAKEETQFPLGEKLPLTNNPVALFGQVPRFQREQELEYFLSKQCNSMGIRLQSRIVAVENNFVTNQEDLGQNTTNEAMTTQQNLPISYTAPSSVMTSNTNTNSVN